MYGRVVPPSKTRRSPKPQERQRDPERTRKLILDAAVAEFSAHGFAGARISAIASRAGVNQQLISYYFDGKEGLYKAISENWQKHSADLVMRGTDLSGQVHHYVMEAVNNPAHVRLLAWGGLEYEGPESDPDHAPRAERMQGTTDEIRELQEEGRLPAELDPAVLTIILMAAAMAPTTLPHVIEGVCGVDPRSPEFISHYADQLAILTKHLGLDSAP
jgi:AcrR family transcriptional regulator